jgi:hypothetical protein
MRGDEHVARTLRDFGPALLDPCGRNGPGFAAGESRTAATALRFGSLPFGLDDLVVLAGVPHPIPSRTRSLSPPAPMVLCLKAWESRSPPGLQDRTEGSSLTETKASFACSADLLSPGSRLLRSSRRIAGLSGRAAMSFQASPWMAIQPPDQGAKGDAGWSSPVARQAHNLKVTGSNPVPAPRSALRASAGPFSFRPSWALT